MLISFNGTQTYFAGTKQKQASTMLPAAHINKTVGDTVTFKGNTSKDVCDLFALNLKMTKFLDIFNDVKQTIYYNDSINYDWNGLFIRAKVPQAELSSELDKLIALEKNPKAFVKELASFAESLNKS